MLGAGAADVSPATLSAGKLQYQLTSTSVPPGAGTIAVTPSSPTGDGFYDAGTTVSVSAFAAPGYQFASFSGSLTGSTNPQSLVMNGPAMVVVDFCTLTFSQSGQPLSAAAYNGSINLQAPGACTWSVISDVGWLTLPQGTPGLPQNLDGTGSLLLNYNVSANTGPAQRVGHLSLVDRFTGTTAQTFTVTQAASNLTQGPALVSLTPFQGTGIVANLTLVYAHPSGWAAIKSAEFIVNPRWEPNSRTGGCYVKYAPAMNLFTLIADDGNSVAGTTAPGSPGNVSNSQCTVVGANSSVTGNGTTLTVNVLLNFPFTGFAGQKHIWMQAVDYNNLSTNWLVYGVWFPSFNTFNTTAPFYRVYDPFSKSYLNTDQNEYNILGLEGFAQLGMAGLVMTRPTTVAGVSNIAWYRVYVNSTSSHFWTSDRNEFLTLINQQQAYVGEGVAAFMMPYINALGQVSPQVTNTMPFWRAAYQGANLHYWTSDPDEYNGTNGKQLPPGYKGEGIACYIFPTGGAQGIGTSAQFNGGTAAPAEEDGMPAAVTAVNAASQVSNGVIVPGQALTVYGRQLRGRVLLNGVPAQVIGAQDNEFRVVAPYDLAPGAEATLEVEHQGRRSKPVSLTVVASDPAIFGTNQYGKGMAQARNEDGTTHGNERPAARGSVVTLYTTGVGSSGMPVEVHIGGQPAEVISTLMSGTRPGVTEVQVRVPETVEPAPFQPVVLRVGNLFSQPGVGLAIR
jgi:uncharacterized protein (TIGR03437 family)